MTDDLVRQLEAAGQEDLAQTLRSRRLAEQLRDGGHTDLAAELDGTRPGAEESAEDPNEVFLQQLKDAQSKSVVSLPGLLDV